jgi:UDP-N-acetylmuramoyl-tripeptide--D-alanyl-D-alanine ligase
MSVSLSLEAATAATGGVLRGDGAARFRGVGTDTRQLRPGQAFVALVGERFDGHEFLSQAVDAGAALLIVDRAPSTPLAVAVLQVEDTRLALGALARAWRREVRPSVVAITGSVGKTTTKELTRAITGELGSTHSTRGNLNNDVGLPLTLLAMERGTRYLVAEMGMNAPGEISCLAAIAEPDVGAITCIAPVHLEGLGSIEAVAAAKGELLQRLGQGAWAVVPGDERLLDPYLATVPASRRVRFGGAPEDEVRLLDVQARGTAGSDVALAIRGETVRFRLPLVGAHNARNAAAAAAIGVALGAPAAAIATALAREPELSHRSVLREVGAWRVLDDCYNANPVAMCAALDTVAQLAEQTPAVAVLGCMLELGATTERLHHEVGAHAAGVGLELLVTVGELGGAIAAGARAAGMEPARVVSVSGIEEAARVVSERAAPGSWILVKASRGAHLEGLIDRLLAGAGS